MNAIREHVVLSGPPVATPLVETRMGRREWEAAQEAAGRFDPCTRCEEDGHFARWRVYPHPGGFPAPGVLDEDVEGCHHCTWGPGGTYTRAVRESVDDRDIQVEHRAVDGSWGAWEVRF